MRVWEGRKEWQDCKWLDEKARPEFQALYVVACHLLNHPFRTPDFRTTSTSATNGPAWLMTRTSPLPFGTSCAIRLRRATNRAQAMDRR